MEEFPRNDKIFMVLSLKYKLKVQIYFDKWRACYVMSSLDNVRQIMYYKHVKDDAP